MRCKHCQGLVTNRAGRGLCRQCWDNSKIRKRYSLLAVLGGQAAGDVLRQGKQQCTGDRNGEDRGAEHDGD